MNSVFVVEKGASLRKLYLRHLRLKSFLLFSSWTKIHSQDRSNLIDLTTSWLLIHLELSFQLIFHEPNLRRFVSLSRKESKYIRYRIRNSLWHSSIILSVINVSWVLKSTRTSKCLSKFKLSFQIYHQKKNAVPTFS